MIKRISDDKLAEHAAYAAYNAVEASTLADMCRRAAKTQPYIVPGVLGCATRMFTIDGAAEAYTLDGMYPDDEPHQEVLALEVGEVANLNLGAGGRTVIQRVS